MTTGNHDLPMQRDRSPHLPPHLLEAWRAQFVNRSRPYALQQEDGTYRWVYKPCDAEVLTEHLLGSTTIALSSLGEDGSCRWICLDADGDGADTLPQLVQLAAALTEQALPAFVEASRRGGHLWLLFEVPVPAPVARRVVLRTLEELRSNGLPVPSLEVYPDTAVPGTLGHAVRLPVGIHRLTGKRYPLFDEHGIPCAFTSTEAAVRFLLAWPRVSRQHLMRRAGARRCEGPKLSQDKPDNRSNQDSRDGRDGRDNDSAHADHAQGDASANQARHVVSETCEASRALVHIGTRSAVIRWVDAHVAVPDLLAELAPFTELRKVGRGYLGWCPFHDDRAPDVQGKPGTPSFYAVRDQRYGWSWRCYSTNCAHSIGPLRHSFRLLQDLLELTASQAIREASARWPEADASPADAREVPHDAGQ